MHHRIAKLAVVLALAPSLALVANAAGRSEKALAALDRAAHMPGEILVQWAPGASAEEKAAARASIGGQREERVVSEGWRRGQDAGGEVELLRLPTGLGIAAAVRGIERDAAVRFAEPNWIYFHSATSNDTYYTNGSLWGMYGDATSSPANQWGSQAGEAWAANKTNCGSVYVGIIDEGYMYTHEDLAANAGTNPGEIAGNGVDDDGNGLRRRRLRLGLRRRQQHGVRRHVDDDHGTHVAGTIGGVGGNSKGVAGVCWSVKLMNAKFLGKRGGTTANAIKAVDYFTDLKTRHGLNLVATNNSWGGGGFSQALQDAIGRANSADILFVAAAGNSTYNCETSDCYPAEYPNANVIAVASITNTGAISSFSNYGSTTIDLGAPGSGIWSTVPKSSKGKIVSGYASYSGTSMATPHVSGAAALYAALHPGSSAAQIKAAILNSAVATSSLSGKCVTGGRLNVSGF
jgi:subtilisin family serine protease